MIKTLDDSNGLVDGQEIPTMPFFTATIKPSAVLLTCYMVGIDLHGVQLCLNNFFSAFSRLYYTFFLRRFLLQVGTTMMS